MRGLYLLLQTAMAATEPALEHAPPHGEGARDVAAILMHHVLDQPFLGFRSKHLVFFVFAGVLVIMISRLAIRSYKKGRVPSGIGAFVESLVLLIRDEMAEKNIGHGDGAKWTPLLCSFFFFILVAALLGLMIPVEIISMFTKPFALMIRLFANMLAGHMVITTLLLLIPLGAAVTTALGVSMIPVALGISLFIMMLELLVAFIQAYIFTLLTSIFIGMYAHPAH